MHLGYAVPESPKTDVQKVRDLFSHCMAQRWFEAAELTAVMYSQHHHSNEQSEKPGSAEIRKSSLHEHIIAEPSVPALIRAKSLLRYAEILENNGQVDLARETIGKARAIFNDQGHAFGSLLIEMDQVQSQSAKMPALERIARIQEIKTSLEATGNWHDAISAAQYMYRIALAELSDSTLVETLYEESLKVPGFSPGSIRWILWQHEVFRSLSLRGMQTGRSLPSVKALYDSLDHSEAPRLKDDTANLLSEVYEYLGNAREAAEWKSRVREFAPLVSAKEPFSERIRAATSFPLLDEEIVRLTAAMERLKQQTSDSIPFDQRGLAVLKMCTIADDYLSQYQLLGVEATRQLLDHCFQHVEAVLSRIDVQSRQSCTGHVLQTKARLLSTEATLGPPEYEKLVGLWTKSAVAYEKALHHYQHTNLRLAAGFASAHLALSYRSLWLLTGKLPHSSWFLKAVKLLDEASAIQKQHGLMDASQMTTRHSLNMWFENYRATLHRPLRFWERCVMWLKSLIGMQADSPLIKTKEYLEQLEHAIDRKRHDFSLLATEEALDAKQKLRNNEHVRIVYEVAIPFYALQKDTDRVWLNVQKSKARSVSDLLGLGVVVPVDLTARIDQDGEAKSKLEGERELLRMAQQNETDSQLVLRTKLDAYRDAMRQNPLLRELLELREGVPVTVSRLRTVSENPLGQESKRRILFADYVIVDGRVNLLIALPDGIQAFDLRSTKAQVNDWRKRRLQIDHFLDYDDDEDNAAALQELTPLVEPLGQVSEAGDLIVLCASGALHAIPLHAAPLGEKRSGTCLIDRNPVVYCPSMTVFEQCVKRAQSVTLQDPTSGQALLAVYETPDNPGWKEWRAQAYGTFMALAEVIEDARVFTGAEVTDERFREECETAKIVHFLGHCNSSAENVMQYLVLAARSHDAKSRQQADDAAKDINIGQEVPTAPFTISNLFATSVRATHFNLIACGSASQVIGSGDEPWGIVTALLCAGATSVEGTMWPIQVGTGELFMKKLYKDLGSGGSEGIVDLAVAHQTAVKRLRRSADTRAPCHWAAFVLHGAWFYQC